MGLMEEHKGGGKSGQRNSVPTSKFQAHPPPPTYHHKSPKFCPKIYIKNLLILREKIERDRGIQNLNSKLPKSTLK
jgi:hypothetical protein